MKISVLVFLAISLGGCAARTPLLEAPTIDMAGVDQAKYNNDLSQCQQLKVQRNAEVVWTAGIISDCMSSRGYRVLERKS